MKKTVEGLEDEFSEAMLPLAEIADEEEKLELAKELLNYVAKVMAVHNKRLDDEKIKEALKPVFHERTENMVKTIFEEKYLEGETEGEAKFGRNAVLNVLRKRFTKVPKKIEAAICQMSDPIALDSLNVHAAVCQTLDEFAETLS